MLFAASIAYLEFRTMLINPQELWLLLNNQFSKVWKLNDPVPGLYEHLPTASGATAVEQRMCQTSLATPTVTGPVEMWAKPISVEFRQQDLTLYLTSSPTVTRTSTQLSRQAQHLLQLAHLRAPPMLDPIYVILKTDYQLEPKRG